MPESGHRLYVKGEPLLDPAAHSQIRIQRKRTNGRRAGPRLPLSLTLGAGWHELWYRNGIFCRLESEPVLAQEANVDRIMANIVPLRSSRILPACQAQHKPRHISATIGGRRIIGGSAVCNTQWKRGGIVLTRDRFYCGKKVAYVYRASKEIRGTKIRLVNSQDPEIGSCIYRD